MLRDLGSRDIEFVNTVKFVRSGLLALGNLSNDEYTAIPMQGSGTFAVESVITTFVPRKGGKLLLISNGSYGSRIELIAKTLGIDLVHLKYAETEHPDLAAVEDVLKKDKTITNVACVHCETSSGIINPVEAIGQIVKKHNPAASYFVDAMSSFGGVPLDLKAGNIHFLVSSANKCIQGVPGFGFVLADRARLAKCAGQSRSLSLDLVGQVAGLDNDGQFRFTPPTHSLLAFATALRELNAEGGVSARAERYKTNKAVLQKGMTEMGFRELLSPAVSSYIITTYHFPADPRFVFSQFYSRLSDKGFVIYPGKVTQADCFRIGSIGALTPENVKALLQAVREVCADMGVKLPLAK